VRDALKPLWLGLIPCRTQKEACLHQNIHTPIGDFSLNLFDVSLGYISGGIDKNMAILILVPFQCRLDYGGGTEFLGEKADLGETPIDEETTLRVRKRLSHGGFSLGFGNFHAPAPEE
jgi:hypothetical protein